MSAANQSMIIAVHMVQCGKVVEEAALAYLIVATLPTKTNRQSKFDIIVDMSFLMKSQWQYKDPLRVLTEIDHYLSVA